MSKDSPSVLVVEDHAVFTTALLHMLQKGNIEVRDVATTAEEALQKLRDLQVGLVLVDISLPHMSGLDLVSEVNKLYPELPCVVLSGHVANHYVRRTRLRGQRQCRRAFRRDTARPGWGIYIANGLNDSAV